jgi:hypothetical protein
MLCVILMNRVLNRMTVSCASVSDKLLTGIRAAPGWTVRATVLSPKDVIIAEWEGNGTMQLDDFCDAHGRYDLVLWFLVFTIIFDGQEGENHGCEHPRPSLHGG